VYRHPRQTSFWKPKHIPAMAAVIAEVEKAAKAKAEEAVEDEGSCGS
jgi:hypothetical protein